MYRLALSLLFLSFATAATAAAAEKPLLGPPPPWVRPAALPLPDSAPTDAAVKILLRDEQINFAPAGDESYVEKLFLIQTPQGLDDMGTINLPWNPDTETLTVHKLHILRGGRHIDILAGGQTFTILRRENNLEGAMLDGVLTASIQPAGLRVGDMIDLAYSLHEADPALGGVSETIAGGWADLPITHLRFRARWANDTTMRWRASDAITGLQEQRAADSTEVTLARDNVEPLALPEGAPPRFLQGGQIDFSGFASWAQLATRFLPLYEKAETLHPNSPLHAEIARIAAATRDPASRAAAALALVQDQVHYFFIGLNDGGLVPADADVTWSRRFGDCKGKTVLLLALLHGLGITAEPVLVNARDGDGLDSRLPMIELFDHVLVRVTIDGRTYWLDGTRVGDRRLADIAVPPFYWGLPLLRVNAALVPITPQPLTLPTDSTQIRIDATAGLYVPAPFHVESVFRGDRAIDLKLQFADLRPAELDRGLRKYWLRRYDFVDVKSVTARFDEASGTEHLTMDGMARMDWSDGRYETDGMVLGNRPQFNRFADWHRDAPFAVPFPVYTSTGETIVLPYAGARFSVDGDDVDQTVAGTHYWRKARIEDGVFTAQAFTRSVAPEFPAAAAQAATQALRDMSRHTVYLRPPDNYLLKPAEVAAELARPLTTARAFLDRGNMLLDHLDYDHAIDDFSHAIALDGKNSVALADRGLAYVWKNDYAHAYKDLEAAFALDTSSPVVFRARGVLCMLRNDYASAIANFTVSLNLDPGNVFALLRRGRAYALAGDDDHALDDANQVTSQRPDIVEAYLQRANIYRRKSLPEKAMAEADAATAANPGTAYAYTVSGLIYQAFGKTEAAMNGFDRAIELDPTDENYLRRAQYRPKTDLAGRGADLAAALRLNPRSLEALTMRAQMQYDAGTYTDAVATLASAMAIDGESFDLLVSRGIAYAKSNHPELADKDFAAARAKASGATELNTLCWRIATAGVSLGTALAACDAALALAPTDANILDSRGFALLRLARFDEAIAAYSAALKLRPSSPYSLYGRGIAERRKGNPKSAGADLAAALAINHDLATEFASYGINP